MIKRALKGLIGRAGFDLVRVRQGSFPYDFDEEVIEIIRAVRPYTMTSEARLFALIHAVKYIIQAEIPGSFVECGVWQGGSMMAVAHVLQRLGSGDRDLYLFDTYAGMTGPTHHDMGADGLIASSEFQRTRMGDDTSDWCFASLEQVTRNLISTGYDPDRLKFIKGKVEETVPHLAPTQISLLRLDTDWYESTRHELIHLYPRLSPGGVLIIDDYGYWQGSRKAVDEYLAQHNITMLLNRVDSTARIGVKMPETSR